MYDSTSEKCFRLSSCVLSLSGQLDERAEARIVFNLLAEHTSELGAGVNAVSYLPALSMRAEQAVELVKCSQRVIYLLNLAHREEYFREKSISEALALAVSIANDINGIVQAYCTGTVPQSAPTLPDGFDMPYTAGKNSKQ